ncbi:hypothetical protein HXX76_009048 [Chlamydomonas incerta]|uniref:Protein kinase domain-containing protein n=1 Tax=Chlamydomonas incerta TaxID=51695 RepID=A0A835SV65_CHLIN|nr:hypothetical protein HXX76_009048 [Chlamydomonas incerta]|eukprot:KAG2432122.1 hypothetical protein HXX76_009048 [Chlamydomonas incerta]
MLDWLPAFFGLPRLGEAASDDDSSACFTANGDQATTHTKRQLWDPAALRRVLGIPSQDNGSPCNLPSAESVNAAPKHLNYMRDSPPSSSSDDCTTDGGSAFPSNSPSAATSASPSAPTSASNSTKAHVPTDTTSSPTHTASEGSPLATGEIQVQREEQGQGHGPAAAASNSAQAADGCSSCAVGGSRGAREEVEEEKQEEVCMVVTYADGSHRRFAASVVKAFRKQPLHEFLERHGLQCWRSGCQIGRGSYGDVFKGQLQLPDGTTAAAAAKLFLGGPVKAKQYLLKEVAVPLQLQQQQQQVGAGAAELGGGLCVRLLAHGGRPGQLPMMVMELAEGCVYELLEEADNKRYEALDALQAAQQQAAAAAAAAAVAADNAAARGAGEGTAPMKPAPPPGFGALPAPPPPPGFKPLAPPPPPPAAEPAVRLALPPPGFKMPGAGSSTGSSGEPQQAGSTGQVWEDMALLPVGEMLAVLSSLAAALQALHGLGLVHNDVKPENVLRRADGTFCLADFGLASQLSPASAAGTYHLELASGTPHFMAPEVTELSYVPHPEEAPLTAAVDVYAFGVTALCVAVTGSRSSAAEWFAEQSWRRGAFPAGAFPAYLPVSLELLVAECVAFRPQDRPTAAQLVRRLAAIGAEVAACGC